MKKQRVINLAKLLFYYEELNSIMNRIYPETITWENVYEQPLDLDVKHPKWVQAHFPLVMIYHKPKAGKLRNSTNLSIMYQNNFNVLTQLVPTADDFGMYNRKLKHKGFSDIVGAIQADDSDRTEFYDDQQKPKKYKNFLEFSEVYAPGEPYIKIMCEVLSEHYNCDSVGQIRLL